MSYKALKIILEIKELSTNPFPDNSKKMIGFPSVYRIRINKYRVIYRVEKQQLVIEIIKIGHRQNIYK